LLLIFVVVFGKNNAIIYQTKSFKWRFTHLSKIPTKCVINISMLWFHIFIIHRAIMIDHVSSHPNAPYTKFNLKQLNISSILVTSLKQYGIKGHCPSNTPVGIAKAFNIPLKYGLLTSFRTKLSQSLTTSSSVHSMQIWKERNPGIFKKEQLNPHSIWTQITKEIQEIVLIQLVTPNLGVIKEIMSQGP